MSLLQPLWSHFVNLSNDINLLKNPFFFLLIIHSTQFTGCIFFTIIDIYNKRKINYNNIGKLFFVSLFGFLPFIYFHTNNNKLYIMNLEMNLDHKAPYLYQFILQFIIYGLIGDLFHYNIHKLLHNNIYLKNNIHSLHHNYDDKFLYSWILMQVHPIEILLITCAIYTPMLLFGHPMVLWFYSFFASLHATIAHSGYNIYLLPSYFIRPQDHQIHHEINSTKNYGNILKIWDIYFDTYK